MKQIFNRLQCNSNCAIIAPIHIRFDYIKLSLNWYNPAVYMNFHQHESLMFVLSANVCSGTHDYLCS